MAAVALMGVNVLNNPAKFGDKYELEITFECYEDNLQKDLEWKLTYVGSATSDQYDQELDSLLVGPIPRGVNKFVFEADPPDTKRIPDAEILGVTVVLLTCAYDGREFVRVGYYVNNEYDTEELAQDPPAKPVIEHIRRNVLAEKPRVTRFAIKWDSEETAPPEFPPEQPNVDAEPDEDEYGKEERELEEAELAEESGPAEATPVPSEDAEMAGIDAEGANAPQQEESGDEGSVDLENETDDDELLEGEVEGEEGDADMADADAMEVDDGKPPAAKTADTAMAT
ncbi:uncharacterized protein MKZ38_002733 [Zalerion maritima]|uniref:Histone chaperone n=1 Tax=Zalerion maritima TaxID=339359 RepID=A0AAD5RNI3_9PEZI|nr:uncharacterized protein MKZ38_002733 [Zalerion maritima]